MGLSDEIIGEAVPVRGQKRVDYCEGRQGLLVCTAQCQAQFGDAALSAECQPNEGGLTPDSDGDIDEGGLRRRRRQVQERSFQKLCFCFVECSRREDICDDTTTASTTSTTTPTTSTTTTSTSTSTTTTLTMTTSEAETSASSSSSSSTSASSSSPSEGGGSTACAPGEQSQSQNVAVRTGGGSSQVGVSQSQQQSGGCGDQSQVQNVIVDVADPDNPKDGDCEVSQWTAWMPCSVSCGGGEHSRLRTVIEPQAENGRRCPPLVETESCNVESCAEDCLVSEWSVVVACSVTCGGGQKTRVRTVVRAPEDGGKKCPSLLKLSPCNEGPCPERDCQVSAWKKEGDCSRTCGRGIQIYTRTVEVYPSEGGEPCPGLVKQEPCREEPCQGGHHSREEVDCEVSSWFHWSGCSRSCGGGWRERYREVLREREGRGRRCPQLEDRVRCNRFQCHDDECSGSKSKSKSKSKRRCRSGKSKRKHRKHRRGGRSLRAISTRTHWRRLRED